MGIFREKPVESQFFYELWRHNGRAFRLSPETTPFWLRRFPHVYASGDSMSRIEIWDELRFEAVVGGIDVIREDPKDYPKGIRFNKDHYVVTSGNLFVAYGPLRGEDHWLPEFPLGLKDIPYFELNRNAPQIIQIA